MRFYFPYKLSITFILCILHTLSSVAQPPHINTDSLLNEAHISTSNSARFELFNLLSHTHKQHSPNIAIKYAQKSLFFAEKDKNYKSIALANRNIGAIFLSLGKVDEAYAYQSAAFAAWEKEGTPNAAIEKSVCLNYLGAIHLIKGDWYEALDLFNKGLSFLGDSKKDREAAISILSNIGILYAEQKNYKQARIYHIKVLEKTTELSDSVGISIALTNIGETYDALEDPNKALEFYTRALTISKSINDIYGIGYLYTNMGIIYYKKGAIELAEDYLSKATKLANKLDVPSEKIRIYHALAKIEQIKKNYSAANKYAKKGLVLAKEMKNKKYIKDLYETLAQNYESRKKYIQALSYYKLFKETNDSLFSTEKNRQITELSIQYETEKKENENQFLKEEQAKNKALLQRRSTLNWTVFLFLGLVSVIAYNLFVNNRRKEKYNVLLEEKVDERTKELKNANAKLKRSNSDLEQFAYITSHDLKEPLRNIMSFTSLIARNLGSSLDEQSKEYMSIVRTNVSQMDSLIEGVLSYARVKKIDFNTEQVDLNQIIEKLRIVLKHTIEEKKAVISTHDLHTIRASSPQIFIVLKNLVENALKYNTQQPNIQISSKKVGEMYHIEVKDNGIGINEEYQSKIFTIFKRLHNRTNYEGVGIGLSTCKKIIQNLGGDIWVESKEGEGSRFIFSIPT